MELTHLGSGASNYQKKIDKFYVIFVILNKNINSDMLNGDQSELTPYKIQSDLSQ